MKKWNNIIFLVLSMLVVGCSDNDENPVGFYTSSGGDRIEGFSASVGESWLRAGAGRRKYRGNFRCTCERACVRSAVYSFKRGGRAPSDEGKYRKRVVYKNFLLTDV